MKNGDTSKEAPIKVWITRYALTKGIQIVENAILDKENNTIAYRPNNWTLNIYKPHWHESEKEALVQVEKMRQNKINSLKKQLAKLEKLEFIK